MTIMAKIQYWPVNKFPWLTNEEISRLESYTANLTWAAQLDAQHKLYEEVINYKQQQSYNNDRAATINELSYRWVQANNHNERKKSSSLSRQEILANYAKEHYNLPYDTDTNTVLQWVVKDAQMKWVSPDLLKKYISNWDESFLYEMWYKEESTLKNIGQWIYDSLAWTTAFLDKYVATPIAAWIAKMMPWVDSEKVDQEKAKVIDQIENKEYTNIWWNRESTSYAISNTATDLAQLVWGENAAVKALTWIPKVAKLINVADKLWDVVEKFPVLWKLTTFTAKKWTQWVADTILYNAINWEWTDLWEMEEWALLNTALWAAWKFVPTNKWTQSLAKKLEVQGLVNWKILETVNTELKKAGSEELQWVKSAWNWLLNRNINGSRQDIVNQLWDYAKTFSEAKNELLDISQTFKESEYSRLAIDWLKWEYKNSKLLTPKIKDKIKWLEMLDWKTTFRAKEIRQIEDAFDEVANLYKNSTELKAGFDNIPLDEIRRWMKEDIENIIREDWLWDMRAINNEIQVANTLKKWIEGKLYSEEAQSIVPKSYSSFAWTILELSWFPRIMRGTANLLAKFSWMEKKSIAKKLEEVWDFDETFLKKVVPENKWDAFMDAFNDLVWKENKSLALTNQDKTLTTKKSFKKNDTTKKKKDYNIKWIIRKYLLTQTEESLDEE